MFFGKSIILSNAAMPSKSQLDKKPNNNLEEISTTSTKKEDEKVKNKEDQPELKKNLITKNELEEQQYLEERQKEKLKQQLEEKKYKNISIRLSPEENICCLAIDGDQNSKDAYELVISEFLNRLKNSVLICPHIYNNLHDQEYNWRYQKEFVLEHFKTRLITTLADYQGYLVLQDRNPYKNHEIEQAYEIAKLNNCLYFFCGFNGLREQTLKSGKIDIGLDFLLSSSDIPVFIMKDNLRRKTKNRGYKWLIIMDRTSSDCFKIFDLFLPFFDIDRDFIYGLTLLPSYIAFDDIKIQFYNKMKELELDEEVSFAYQAEPYTSSPLAFIKEFVNLNTTDYFDYVIFYNNPDKYKFQKKDSESFKMIKSLKANIAFTNIAYKEGYDYKVIGKLPNEIDERKYLSKVTLPSTLSEDVKSTANITDATTFTSKVNQNKDDKSSTAEGKSEIPPIQHDDAEIKSEVYTIKKGGLIGQKVKLKEVTVVHQKEDPKEINKNKDSNQKKTSSNLSNSNAANKGNNLNTKHTGPSHNVTNTSSGLNNKRLSTKGTANDKAGTKTTNPKVIHGRSSIKK